MTTLGCPRAGVTQKRKLDAPFQASVKYYRREDTAPYARLLYDWLTRRYGEDQVFIDIDQIEPGEDFVEVINRKVGACDIAIVAIGPNWLRATEIERELLYPRGWRHPCPYGKNA